MRTRTCFLLLALAAPMGCGGGDDAKAGSGGTEKPTGTIDIAVDANRDGVVKLDDPEDQKEDAFDATHGASFLANLDDDNGDHVIDVEDEVVNGDEDARDLARILVRAFPGAPDGATGSFTIDALAAANVRLFKKNKDGTFTLIAGSMGPCDGKGACMQATEAKLSLDDVRAGLELGIEGRTFRRDRDEGSWDGMVHLRYEVRGADGKPVTTADAPEGADEAVMRVAPWILFGNLSAFDTAWASNDVSEFVDGLSGPLGEAKLDFRRIKNWADDQWTQDFFQTAYTAMPGPNGTVQGMRIANPRPWGRIDGNDYSLPINWLRKSWLGADRGIVVIYKEAWTGSTYDSHGNHDLLPPYTNGADSFPLGRIIHGSDILPETHAFYEAQSVQGPPLVVDTSWLAVGHVDEFLSYVPAKTPRGWKLLVGSPKLARAMLQKAQADGHGGELLFAGKQRWKGLTDILIDAQVTINQLLANTDVMTWSQEAQTEIDAGLEVIRAAVGLADDEIIEIPYLFEADMNRHVAYQPGTVNLLAFGDHVIHPDPFGPVIDGQDIFKKDLLDRLGTPVNALGSKGQGLEVHFADDWYGYHINEGEVHCGSNVDAAPPASDKWWETGR